jgi:anti-sigma regulatory factor (Ser/Thr protein kinase)
MPRPPAPSSGAQLQFELTCELAGVRQAAHRIQTFLETQGCSPDEVMACQLAFVEACNNAIEHAGAEAKTKPIVINATCGTGEIAMSVTDHTPGFDLPSRAAFPGHAAERGRGVPLILSLIDHVEYHRGPGQNTLFLRKRRSVS